MAAYLRFIGFLVLALALWQTASDAFVGATTSAGHAVNETVSVCGHADTVITTPQLPYLPDAELAGTSMQIQLLGHARVQRLCAAEYLFTLKGWMMQLSQREASLSLHREKLYDATAHRRCQPVCEYFIFTLKRILI